ncbi:DUF6708 domain-containing protein [Pseudomonas sp. Je.1.5.c]|uniref:DUF6708 domain-containing protein n=1 Tax=Pseudomonas sp. Je.1.5.c TaxID=3142839 RepID=UPI003DA99F5C
MKTHAPTMPRRSQGWKYDLSKPNEPPELNLSLRHLYPAPNQINNINLELSRSSLRIRGLGSLVGTILTASYTVWLLQFLYETLTHQWEAGVDLIVFTVGFSIVLYWLVIPSIRMDIELPRDEPIRFNRLRRKVYFYQYHYDRFHLFSRQRWGVRPVVYDWDDLVAEACSVYAPMGNGGLIESVMISVIKPGTEAVIDRLFFTHDIERGKQYWALVQLFMQQGPHALPDFVHPPRDWNDDAQLSFIRRIAPKVRWPDAIDLQSRTAPLSG